MLDICNTCSAAFMCEHVRFGDDDMFYDFCEDECDQLLQDMIESARNEYRLAFASYIMDFN